MTLLDDIHNQEKHEKFWATLSTFTETTAMEVRFHSTSRRDGTQTFYQLLVTANEKGSLSYTLSRHPRTSPYNDALTNLAGIKENTAVLPMKAFKGWQYDALAWLMGLPHYTIDEVL